MLDDRVRAVLARLEAEDRRDAELPFALSARSLAIAPTTGAFLYALCACRPGCAVLELGGSRGYSTIWLAAGARTAGGRVVSLEADPARRERATGNLAEAGLSRWVEIVPGDAFETVPALDGAFELVFLDAWKDDYERFFELLRPRVPPGGLVVADNVLSHVETLASYSAARQRDETLVSVTIPLDSGLELTSVLPTGYTRDNRGKEVVR